MNAVERLLAHGEDLLSLFDEMYRERLGSGRDPTLPDVPQGLIYTVGHKAIDSVSGGRSWASSHWLQAAVESAWHEARQPERGQQATIEEVAARSAEIFNEHLTERERLLNREAWMRMVRDVVSESRAWEPLSAKVVALAEQVCDAVQQVSMLSDDLEPGEWSEGRFRVVTLKPLVSTTVPAKRASLRQALDLLHPYAQPPKEAPSSPAERADNGKPVGRPQNNEDLARDLLDGWRNYKPENGRPRKDDYLAQRPDVRVLKTEQARQAKIASLRTALNSALALRRSKARLKRKARG